jgi:hypothetical protein
MHRFGKGIDRRTPADPMIYEGGNLVGTTFAGGAYGYGTAFSDHNAALSPAVQSRPHLTASGAPVMSLVGEEERPTSESRVR